MNFCYVITFFRLGFFLPSPELVYMWFRQRHIPGSVVACFFNSRFCKRSVFFLFLSIFIFCYVISKFCEVVIVILALFYRSSPCSAFLPGFFQDTGCITNFINDDVNMPGSSRSFLYISDPEQFIPSFFVFSSHCSYCFFKII